MALALILSSHVAGSRVGGFAQSLVLAQQDIDPVCVPTVLFGRHPGWGAPGGAAVADDVFIGMLAGLDANGLFGLTDLMLTGYFATAGQVDMAARIVRQIREADRAGAFAPEPLIMIDPVMGDDGKGLYVKPEVAAALAERLVGQADVITPNAWELAWLTGQPVVDPPSAISAARSLGKACLVSSVRNGPQLATLLVLPDQTLMVSHPALATAPNGTGDLLSARFGAALLAGSPPQEALSLAVSAVWACLQAASQWQAPELPLVAAAGVISDPPERLPVVVL